MAFHLDSIAHVGEYGKEKRSWLTDAAVKTIDNIIDGINNGVFEYEEIHPQNYVVFDDSVISIEEKYQFSVKNDPEIRPIAMEYLRMLEATVPPKPAKSAGAAAATCKISEDLLGQLLRQLSLGLD